MSVKINGRWYNHTRDGGAKHPGTENGKVMPAYVPKTREECRVNQSYVGGYGHTGHKTLKMTPRQRDVYLFLKHFMLEYGFPPSNREIATGLGLKSAENIRRILHVLAGAGVIEFTPYKWRSAKRLGGVYRERVYRKRKELKGDTIA